MPQAGWRGSKDSSLLELAGQSFEVFVTIDRTVEREHDLSAFKFGTIIVHVSNNKLGSYEPLFEQLRAAAERIRSGEVLHVGHRLS